MTDSKPTERLVDEMSSDQLNKVAAEFAGWRLVTKSQERRLTEQGVEWPDRFLRRQDGHDPGQVGRPEYTKDWQLAGELLELMAARGLYPELVSLSNVWGVHIEVGGQDIPFIACDQSPQLAITKAFVIAALNWMWQEGSDG